jgi:hypothetical protein
MSLGSCLRRQVSPRGPRCPIERAVSVSLSTIVVLIVLPVIAFASPPDPSWNAGFYDGADGDGDDVITLVYETAAVDLVAPSQVALLRCLPEVSLDGIVRGLPGCCFTHGPRAPPVSNVSAHVFNSNARLHAYRIKHRSASHPASITTFRSDDLNVFIRSGVLS